MHRNFLAIFLLVFSHVTYASDPCLNLPAEFSSSSIAELINFIECKKIKSLEDFLPNLSQNYKANFVLMRSSKSLQPTNDDQSPRVIMHGRQLLLAFNEVSNSLELIENTSNHDFKFKRINFPKNKADPIVLKENCAGCHNGRPLWGQYREWNGMYGGDQENIPTGSLEMVAYEKFLVKAKNHPLYKNLIFKCGIVWNDGLTPGYIDEPNIKSDMPPCVQEKDLIPNYYSKYESRERRRMYQPAEGLGEVVNRMNSDRLYYQVKSNADYSKFKYAVVANQMACVGERMYAYNTPADQVAFDKVRATFRTDAVALETKLKQKLNTIPRYSLQKALLNQLGIDLSNDLRPDIRFDTGKTLGLDFNDNAAYSPNPAGRTDKSGDNGYPAYSDGTDFAADLVGYLVMRDLYQSDSDFETLMSDGLQASFDYHSSLPIDSGTGWSRSNHILEYTYHVMEDLTKPSAVAVDIPKYMQGYVFSNLMISHGEKICKYLIQKATP